jgi:hypothetical protein
MLLKPRRFNSPVNVEVAAPFNASLVLCDSSAMTVSLAGSLASLDPNHSSSSGEEPSAAEPGAAAKRRHRQAFPCDPRSQQRQDQRARFGVFSGGVGRSLVRSAGAGITQSKSARP